ncbi:MAG TPA: septation protein A [Candidatus Thiothrix moscowensis]|uniref:septation protein A n=1 Tax=unclassified Thiothrix TaxID=2636184 RepID=UPI0025FDE184|nr:MULTISPECIES: septation protein A [unclassified Thiothrix]HRJ52194.1 septation protein A [Candidatus Thiothrix moscowensis]HRJ92295.1 septation protein A [Candidatus Thiothrix moscowensis]
MKFLFDFFPVVLFFLVYKFFGDLPPAWIGIANQFPFMSLNQNEPKDAILLATLVIILATILQNVLYFAMHRRFERMHLITLGILLAFGTLTLFLKDPLFIKWKVSIINWAFAIAFIASQYIGTRKTLVERMMSQAIQTTPDVWKRVNLMWAVFFVAVGILNLIVAYGFSEDAWVDFKLFGVLGLTFVFVIAQAIYLQKHATESGQ